VSLSLAGNGTLTGVDLDALSATGSLPYGLLPVGSVLQVVSSIKTDTFTTASTSYVAVTGLTASITPKGNTHKVLIIASVNISNTNTGAGGSATMLRLSGGNAVNYDGVAAGSRLAAPASIESNSTLRLDVTNQLVTLVYLDSPATASAVTYGVDIRTILGSATVNRTGIDTDANWATRTSSSITLMEVAA
jgi:hypothetical protein